jgi:hypothetical protein
MSRRSEEWTVDTADQWVTLDEAAHRAGRSVKTLRRWIKNGKLPAELVDTDHGQAYRVNVNSLEEARRVVDVVKVERPPDTAALAAAIAQALEQRDAQWMQAIADLHAEVRQLREQLQERPQITVQEPTAELITEATEKAVMPPAQRSWWRRWFGG